MGAMEGGRITPSHCWTVLGVVSLDVRSTWVPGQGVLLKGKKNDVCLIGKADDVRLRGRSDKYLRIR
jgi:hypothetical protein